MRKDFSTRRPIGCATHVPSSLDSRETWAWLQDVGIWEQQRQAVDVPQGCTLAEHTLCTVSGRVHGGRPASPVTESGALGVRTLALWLNTQERHLSHPIFCYGGHMWDLGCPGGSDSKESAGNVGDPVGSLGWEDPLEEGMATHSSILAWRIPWTEEPGGLQSTGSQRVRPDWVTNTFTSAFFHVGS